MAMERERFQWWVGVALVVIIWMLGGVLGGLRSISERVKQLDQTGSSKPIPIVNALGPGCKNGDVVYFTMNKSYYVCYPDDGTWTVAKER